MTTCIFWRKILERMVEALPPNSLRIGHSCLVEKSKDISKSLQQTKLLHHRQNWRHFGTKPMRRSAWGSNPPLISLALRHQEDSHLEIGVRRRAYILVLVPTRVDQRNHCLGAEYGTG
jgi:hypothetical protein